MPLAFSPKAEERFQELLTHYPNKQAPLLMVLHLAQEDFGHVNKEVQEYVAKRLSLPVAHVYGVVTFYTMYHQEPFGKYHIGICTNLSCEVLGGQKIWEHCTQKLKIGNRETTPDGRFTLEEVECLAACGGAPCAQVNGQYHEKLTVESVDKLLDSLK
jgi:NADH-quinone oxidoreductase subunit E